MRIDRWTHATTALRVDLCTLCKERMKRGINILRSLSIFLILTFPEAESNGSVFPRNSCEYLMRFLSVGHSPKANQECADDKININISDKVNTCALHSLLILLLFGVQISITTVLFLSHSKKILAGFGISWLDACRTQTYVSYSRRLTS
jgi:hypothetical protein